MKIAVMGAGGIGGWLGARLAANGENVNFIARGEHLQAMRKSGLKVSGADCIHLEKVIATDNPKEIGPVDVILFCVKLYDTQAAVNVLSPLIGPNTCVLTVQNGVESAQRISSVIGDNRTLGGCAYFPANIAAPGEIEYVGRSQGNPHIVFGEFDGGSSKRSVNFAKICQQAGIAAEVCENTRTMIWEKFCLVAATSATTALTRQNFGSVCGDSHMRWLLTQAIAEAAAVGRKLGIALDDKLEPRTLDFIDHFPTHGKASQLIDLERGRRLELEGLSGAVVRLGRQTDVPTPVHATVYAALKPFIDGVKR